MAFKLVLYFKTFFVLSAFCIGCASGDKRLRDSARFIRSPFLDHSLQSHKQEAQVVLRSKQGDQMLELVLPAQTEQIGSLIIPFSPFQKTSSLKDPASIRTGEEEYAERDATVTDEELVKASLQPSPLDQERQQIENSLNLVTVAPSLKLTEKGKKTSYLGGLDRIKQLFKVGRYEASLIEVDHMLQSFPADARLFEMKGTLLDKLGRLDLAEKAWRQALEFDPKNARLKNFLNQKGVASVAGASADLMGEPIREVSNVP